MTDWSRVRNFSRSEFGSYGNVKPDRELVRMLDDARDLAGIAFVINSGIRSPARNASVSGTSGSSHLTGKGADIHCADSRSRFLMLSALLSVGFNRIGIYDTHLHVDTDSDADPDVIWLSE